MAAVAETDVAQSRHTRPGRTRAHGVLVPFVAAAFLGAGLLFSVEPLIGKLVLPLLGGSPAVWNTCLLFFQGMLLAGYAYAHYGIRLLGLRGHATLHLALVVVSLLLLPPAIGSAPPPAAGSPVLWLLLLLVRAVGLPFFVLSATAPLVQRWFASTTHPSARDPYFLYAASNLGSLAGLMLYPFVLEPLTGLRAQAFGWSAGYFLFAGLIASLIVWARRRGRAGSAEAGAKAAEPVRPLPAAPAPIAATTALRWTGTAFVPSALLLAVTGYVTTDVAPMPLLWLLPLALYLATFVAAFGTTGTAGLRGARTLQPAVTLIVAGAVVAGYNPMWMLPLHLVALTIASYLGHARLAAERPPAVQLTTFYLWISVGGTLGGVFGVLVAPFVLMPEPEYALLLVAALLLPAGGTASATAAPRTATAIIAAGAVAAAALGLSIGKEWGVAVLAVVVVSVMLQRIEMSRTGLVFAMALFLSIIGTMSASSRGGEVLERDRNFFGTLRVRQGDGYNRLVHGRTLHGAQSLDPEERARPTTYYSADGPLGDVFRLLSDRSGGSRIGVVGLGAGTAACHGRPGDEWDMFEIDPAVVRMALDPRLFTFLEQCAPTANIIIGDGRRALVARDAARYDLLILDAFSSDAIPSHLLTREAFALYADRLAEGGLLAVHISNQHLDLAPVVASNAAFVALHAWVRDDRGGGDLSHNASQWAVMTATAARLDALRDVAGWNPLEPEPRFRPWTDDYTNLISVLRLLRFTGSGQ